MLSLMGRKGPLRVTDDGNLTSLCKTLVLMSRALPLSERDERNVIDYKIKCSRMLLWNAFLNTWLFKYSKKDVRLKAREKRKGGRRGREGKKEGGVVREREGKETEGRKGKKTVVLKSVLIPSLEVPHGCVMPTVPGTNSGRDMLAGLSSNISCLCKTLLNLTVAFLIM